MSEENTPESEVPETEAAGGDEALRAELAALK